MNFKDVAIQYIESGLCAFPAIRSQKRPMGKWKEYQNRFPTAAEWESWQFADAICLVCGKISGNLLMIDFDQQGKSLPDFKEKINPELYSRLVIEQSQSGGFHIILRSTEPVCGNVVLAKDVLGKVLIETRGEKGIFLCAPTPGYTFIQGDFNSIPVLCPNELETLLQAAWSLDQTPKPEAIVPPPPKSSSAPKPSITPSGMTPMEDYNERGRDHFKRFLEKHGWRYTGEEADNERWLRPGKSQYSKEKSASLHHTKPSFYIHSNNCSLPAGKGYSFFYVYTHFEHGGDFVAATKDLAGQGYGNALAKQLDELPEFLTASPEDRQTENEAPPLPMQMPSAFDDFAVENLDEIKQDDIEDPGLIPDSLLNPPGLVGEIAKYCYDTNAVQQQEFALATGITMVAHLIGQNYQTPDACRSNFYALSIGDSGAGKNRAITFFRSRQIKEIVKSIVGTFSGHAALLRYLQKRTKTLLMVWDEVGGKLVEIIKKPNSPSAQLLDYLTELYSSAASSVSADIKVSDIEAPDVIEPHCSLYGTGTFKSVFKAMTPDLIERGFIGRVSFFFADQNKKKRKMHEKLPVPENIREQFKAWIQKPLAIPTVQEGALPLFQVIPEPTVVPYTEEAKLIFDHFSDQCTNAEENTPEDFRCLWVRSVEEAKKLSLIYACSVSIDNPVIDTEAATWACRLSEHLSLRKLYIANNHMAANEQGHLENDILNYVRKKKNKTATQTEITNRFKKGVDPALRKKAIYNLVITGQLVRESKKEKGARKISTVYRIPYKTTSKLPRDE